MLKNDAILCKVLRIVVVDALLENMAHDTEHSRCKYGLSPNPDAVEGIPENPQIGRCNSRSNSTPAMSHLLAGV